MNGLISFLHAIDKNTIACYCFGHDEYVVEEVLSDGIYDQWFTA